MVFFSKSPLSLSLLVLPVPSLLAVAVVVVVVLEVGCVAEQQRLAVVVASVEDPEPVMKKRKGRFFF